MSAITREEIQNFLFEQINTLRLTDLISVSLVVRYSDNTTLLRCNQEFTLTDAKELMGGIITKLGFDAYQKNFTERAKAEHERGRSDPV